ncbi:MAG: thioesterase superfamily protein [Sphingomonas bacterium]|nr:thioesterase superfamily protein [Sphingomonas bacterium]
MPAGFVPVPLEVGYNAAFGPAYVNAAERMIGFRVGPQHLNPVGSCHGGAMATFLDMQIVVAGDGPYETHKPTISLAVDFLAPAALGAWVEAAVSCQKTTRRMVFTQALVTVEGDVVARSSAIYRNTATPA